MRNFTIHFYDIAEYSYLLVAFFAFVTCIKTKRHFPLFLLLASIGIIRTISIQMATDHINTMYLYHIIGFIELVLIYRIYIKKINSYWTIFIGCVTLAYLYNSFFISSISNLNSLGLASVRLVIIILGINYLWELHQKKVLKPLNKIPFFYINAGFMLYAAGTFFIYLMSEKITGEVNNSFFNNAWSIEASFIIIQLCFISYGLVLTIKDGKRK